MDKIKKRISSILMTGALGLMVSTGVLSVSAGAGIDHANAQSINLSESDSVRVANAENVKAVQAAVPIRVKYAIYYDSSGTFKRYNNLSELNVRLYKLKSLDAWKESHKKVSEMGGGGNVFSAYFVEEIRKTGTFVEEWISSDEAHISKLSQGVYVALDENVSGRCGYVAFEVNDKGEWRTSTEYHIEYDPSLGKEVTYWSEPGPYHKGSPTSDNEMVLVSVKENSHIEFYIAVNDKNGKEYSAQSKIEIYRKNGSDLEKVDYDIEDPDEYSYIKYYRGFFTYDDNIRVYMPYPGTYVIKCVSVPEGYRKFNDITIEITRRTDYGTAKVNITDKNRNKVELSSIDKNENYYYAVQESFPALIDITLENTVKASNVKLNKTLMVLDKGKTGMLIATVLPADTDDKTVTWSSSNTNVATVDASGNVKAINHGTAKITARTSNGKTAECEVRVNFIDVTNPKDWYYKAVYWAAEKGITTGTDGKFFHADNCTREQAITFLWRMAGKPNPKSMTSKFSDVKDSKRYSYKAIMWGSENGIITGTNGKFYPTDTCTREQIVTMLWRQAGQPAPKNMNSKFKDVKDSKRYSYKAIMWAQENGITTGTNGLFSPTGLCKRREIVTFIYRYKN